MLTYLIGRELGATLLIAGCCIGAGMLGLPLLTMEAGFLPSALLFVFSWAFMAATGLLVLEVNLWFHDGVNLMTMAKKTLGNGGKLAVTAIFLYLFYCLMVAYSAAGGAMLADLSGLSSVGAGALFSLILALFLFVGIRAIDPLNRPLMILLCGTYALMLVFGFPHVDSQNLAHVNWKASLFITPVMFISFGFHNLIPSLTHYLQGNVTQLRRAILIGSLIPLGFYLLWEALILGAIPAQEGVLDAVDEGALVTRLFEGSVGTSWISTLVLIFSFLAIATSFLAVAMSFIDFLADGMKIKKNAGGRLLLTTLVVTPPFFFAAFNPTSFLTALNVAGAYGAVTLFGIIPVAMVYVGRKTHQGPILVPGGDGTLAAIAAIAILVILLEMIRELT